MRNGRHGKCEFLKARLVAIKFQYNKTSLAEMDKQLRIRTRALPTIKSKESALRLEVKKARDVSREYSEKLEKLVDEYRYMAALWGEFDGGLIAVKDIVLGTVKIAGVKVPVLEKIVFEEKPYDIFSSPAWIADGVKLLKSFSELGLESEIFARKTELLDHARKKTTQKVNLYEKVQIPGYQEARLKIKRFLEDEENLAKSSQKIVKTRQQIQQEEEDRV